ncbi:MAG TPA: DUF2674 domain-containing protein [Candidatus Megaira endosymbiont of Nemacystus decipiens]|nr:DUF2674 domain-containing protein [Candidatus Megaera endosymbiont of Nemacystus decipiens]
MKKIEQKLVAFAENEQEMKQIELEMNDGWSIVSLIRNGNYYAGIMEKPTDSAVKEPGSVFIPPRKGFKIL